MSAPLTSVIIPTYRHRDFILRTLDSVFAQTHKDYEIIVVNDGSPDDTKTVLARLVAAGRIQYVEQPNGGQSHARNRGLELARGKYIAFLDDDDLWPPDKLEWQTDFLEKHANVALISGVVQAIDAQEAPVWKDDFHPEITFESLFAANPFLSPGQTLIRADVLKSLGGMNAQIWGVDDWDLWFRIARKFKIVMTDRLALYYRVHAGNASKQSARMLAAACATIELHLQDLSPSQKESLRQTAHRLLYRGYGPEFVGVARKKLRRGQPLQAFQSLKGLSPLRQSIFSDAKIRADFFDDLLFKSLKRVFSKKDDVAAACPAVPLHSKNNPQKSETPV